MAAAFVTKPAKWNSVRWLPSAFYLSLHRLVQKNYLEIKMPELSNIIFRILIWYISIRAKSWTLFGIFSSFSHHNSRINWKKRRYCAWELNLGSQDGRCRWIHWAMAAAKQVWNNFSNCLSLNLNGFQLLNFSAGSSNSLESSIFLPIFNFRPCDFGQCPRFS